MPEVGKYYSWQKTDLKNYSKTKSIIFVLEGFIVLMAVHAIGGYYFGPKVAELFFDLPLITVEMLASSTISPVVAIVYLALRIKFIPKFNIKKEVFIYTLAGIVIAWMAVFIEVLFLGKEIPSAKELLETPVPYYYFNLFLLLVWGPFFEETLTRGYLFEILRQNWGDTMALLMSSILFVVFHGIWGSFDISLVFIFLSSVILPLIYIHGGLIASITVHSFYNFYLLYLNI